MILLSRIGARLTEPAPPAPHRGAQLAHLGLYALMLGLIATGGGGAMIDGVWEALWGGTAEDLILPTPLRLHHALARALIALAGLHVAAALWRGLARRDGTLERMF